MKKISMQIVDINEQPNPNGLVILRIKAKSEGVVYTFAAKKKDYLDKNKRKELDQNFLETIRESQEQKRVTKSEKDQDTKKLKDLIGKDVEENVY